MADQEHVELLKQGVNVWNRWRQEHPDIQPNLIRARLNEIVLIGADLRGAVLWEAEINAANLSGADLSGADLHKAHLTGTILDNANLSAAILIEAILDGANLNEAILNGANLRRAFLWGARLIGAKLIGTNLSEANLYGAKLIGADLTGASLGAASLVSTDFTKATLNNCDVYGASVWGTTLQETKQENLIITPDYEPTITVDDLEVAQFIYLLLNHKKLRNVLNAVTDRGVLILGRFGDGGLELLQAIAAKLREEKYLPIIFDFDRPRSRNLTETVMTLVGLSRFVIVDLSGRSVANELRATVPHFKIPFVPIIEESRQKEAYSMFSDFLENDWVLPLVIFTSRENLMELLALRVIEPAEKKHQARQKLLDELFNKA